MAQILEAQQAGDADVYLIVERAVYTLGLAIANIDNFTCPHTMLIEGELFRSQDNRQMLLDVVHRNICKVTRTDTDFVFVEPDNLSGARGRRWLFFTTSRPQRNDRCPADKTAPWLRHGAVFLISPAGGPW